MTRQTQILLMFAPFVLYFIGLTVLVNDMRHPRSAEDRCVVTGVGRDAQPYKPKAPYLYKQSENQLQDVSLRCDRLGIVMLNDAQLFITPVNSGQGAHVTHKSYQFLPDRWMVNVRTGEKQAYIPQRFPGLPTPLSQEASR